MSPNEKLLSIKGDFENYLQCLSLFTTYLFFIRPIGASGTNDTELLNIGHN